MDHDVTCSLSIGGTDPPRRTAACTPRFILKPKYDGIIKRSHHHIGKCRTARTDGNLLATYRTARAYPTCGTVRYVHDVYVFTRTHSETERAPLMRMTQPTYVSA